MKTWSIAMLTITLALAGCSGEGVVTAGIEAEITLTNGRTEANTGWPSAEGAQTFYTSADKRIDLGQGLLVLTPLQLTACTSTVASLGRALLDFVLPAAEAHSTHAPAPAGVVDVAKVDGTEWDLGEVGAAPGTYCGAELELGILPQGASGAGWLLYVAPCYYPDSGLARQTPGLPSYPDEANHICYDVAVPGDLQTLAFDFADPVVLDESKRLVEIGLKVEYDTWFDGVDIAALACPFECDPANTECTACTAGQAAAKPGEQENLIANVRASIRVLPPEVAE